MILKVIVAGSTGSGPDLFFCTVQCTTEQYNEGQHYEAAEDLATDKGDIDSSSSLVVFDEHDPPKFLFAAADVLSKWRDAPNVDIRKDPAYAV